MKKFELIAGLIALSAIILKLLHVTGSGLLTILVFSLLAMFYYLGFAIFNGIRFRDIFKGKAYKDTGARRIAGATGLGTALSVILTGAMFKLQIWPGANTLLGMGLFATVVILIVALIFYASNKIEFYNRIFRRIGIIGGLGLVLFLTPSSALIDIYYRNHPGYAELFKQVLADPDNEELGRELQEKWQEMNNRPEQKEEGEESE